MVFPRDQAAEKWGGREWISLGFLAFARLAINLKVRVPKKGLGLC